MGSLDIWGKFSCLTLKFSFHLDLLSLPFPFTCFHSSDLSVFNLDLQVRPGDVCSQVGLCSAHRGQSERSGVFFLFKFVMSNFIYQCFVCPFNIFGLVHLNRVMV